MPNFNQVVLIGRLTGDPVLNHVENGHVPVCSFEIATSRRYTKEDGQKDTETILVDVSVNSSWRKMAEIYNQFLKKDQEVIVMGSLRHSIPEPRKLYVVANQVQILGGPSRVGELLGIEGREKSLGKDVFWVKKELDRMVKLARMNAEREESNLRLPEGELRDSDTMAVYIASRLLKAGVPFRFVAVAQNEDQEFHHVFVQIPYFGQWITLDPHQATMKFAKEFSVSVPCPVSSYSSEMTALSKDPKVKLFRELMDRARFTNVFDSDPISKEKRESLRRFVHLTRLDDQIEALGVALRDCISEKERDDLWGLRQMLEDVMTDIERSGYCELEKREPR